MRCPECGFITFGAGDHICGLKLKDVTAWVVGRIGGLKTPLPPGRTEIFEEDWPKPPSKVSE